MSFARANRLINTLRTRLTVWHLGILALALLLFTILLYVSLETTLYGHHDPELAQEATSLSRVLAGVAADPEYLANAITKSRSSSQFVMVRNEGGSLIYQSPLVEASEPNIGQHEMLVHAAAAGSLTPEFFTATLERWGVVRFICLPIGTRPRTYLQVGVPLGDVSEAQHIVITMCLVLIPVVLLLMSAGGWIVAGRALAPMKAIDETLRSIQATDLSRRIDVQPGDAELGRLVNTLNQLLGRLEQSFASVKQFAADVSHQLQTPLAVMKGSLELMSDSGRSPAEQRRIVENLAAEVDEMAAVLADLRALSLADAGPAAGQREPVDLSATVHEASELLEALAEVKGVRFDTLIQPGLTVWGSAVPLKQVVLNLGDNAVKYTESGGRVTVSLAADGDAAVMHIADTGIGISAHDLPHVFERFFRAGSADTRTSGTGLGLAIVKRIVEAHGGTIHVESEPGEGTRFTVRLRLASA